MVAGERKFAVEYGLNRPEPCIGCIVTGARRLVFADRNFIDNADDVFSGVSDRVAHHHQQRRFGAFQSSFFFKFSNGGVNRVFPLVDKPSWKRP